MRKSSSKTDTDDVKNIKFCSGIFKKIGNLEENEKTKLELVMEEQCMEVLIGFRWLKIRSWTNSLTVS
jgi:hypothetical protein